MSEILGISSRQCERIISAMKNNGTIERIGHRKFGHWIIIGK